MAIDIPTLNLVPVLPLVIVVVTGVLLLALDLAVANKRVLGVVGLAGLVAAGVASAWLWPGTADASGGMLVGDGFTLFFGLVFLVSAGLSLLVAIDYLPAKELPGGEYCGLLLFATAGMMLMAAAGDLLFMFLGLETMSVALYVLVGYNRRQLASVEAAIKYFVLGAFASAVFLYGVALIYGATGSTNLVEIGGWLANGGIPRDPWALAGLALMLSGFAFKVAAVPFQWWTPDVYQGAPTSVTAFMSVGAKAAGFAALIRVLHVAFTPTFSADWMAMAAILAALTMTIGNLAALVQKDLKRLLAYSSIAHAGYILVGVASGIAVGVQGVLFYLMAYTFSTVGAFVVVCVLEGRRERLIRLEDCTGLGQRRPWLAAGMAVLMFSLTGIPPLAGFWGKLFVFRAAVEGGMAWLAVLGVVNSAISAYYYLGVVVQMFMRPAPEGVALEAEGAVDNRPAKGTWAAGAALAIAVLGTVLIGVWPALVMNLVLALPFG